MSERSGVTEPGRLYFTVGLPRSGKSTLANAWARFQDPATMAVAERFLNGGFPAGWPPRPRAIVAGDDFRHALHGQEYRVESEGTVFAAMDVATRALLRRGFDVMVDETCTTQSTLLRYLRMDQRAVPVFVDTPAEVCVARARAEGRDYLVGPIGRMDAQLKALRGDWDGVVAKLLKYVEYRQGLDVAV